MLPFDYGLPFAPERDEEFFAALPPRPAVFLLEPRQAESEPYLGKTADLRRRLERLLRPRPGPSKSLNLREFTGAVRYRLTGSAFEQLFALYDAAHRVFPERCREVLQLRRPVLLKVNLRNPYPRCYVTHRLAADNGFYFGPFVSRRAADRFANEFLDLFKIRRCQIRIRRDPAFPGCIYSEIKMCLAPCFAGCSGEEYAAEVERVTAFLSSRGRQFVRELEDERDSASAALDFERAAALHKKVEKLSDIARGLPEVVQPLHMFNAVVVQRAAAENAVALFRLLRGKFLSPLFLNFSALAEEPRSAEQTLREQLGELPALAPSQEANAEGSSITTAGHSTTQSERENHLTLLARWYYSKPREGELILASKEWPYRRILRACSRVLGPQAAAERPRTQPSEPATS